MRRRGFMEIKRLETWKIAFLSSFVPKRIQLY